MKKNKEEGKVGGGKVGAEQSQYTKDDSSESSYNLMKCQVRFLMGKLQQLKGWKKEFGKDVSLSSYFKASLGVSYREQQIAVPR